MLFAGAVAAVCNPLNKHRHDTQPLHHSHSKTVRFDEKGSDLCLLSRFVTKHFPIRLC